MADNVADTEGVLIEISLHAQAIKMAIEALADEDHAAVICQETHYIVEKARMAIDALRSEATPLNITFGGAPT